MASGDKYTIQEETLTNIGDAVREMTGTSAGVTPENMPAAIRSISSGGDTVSWNQIQLTGTKIAEIDINGTTTDVYAPEGGGEIPQKIYEPTQYTGTDTQYIDNCSVLDLIPQSDATMTIPIPFLYFDTFGIFLECNIFTFAGGSEANVPDPQRVYFTSYYTTETGKKYIRVITGINSEDYNNRVDLTIEDIEIAKAPLEKGFSLSAGSTTVTITDAGISAIALVDVYTDTFGVNPTNIYVTNGSCTLTFEAQSQNIWGKVRFS